MFYMWTSDCAMAHSKMHKKARTGEGLGFAVLEQELNYMRSGGISA